METKEVDGKTCVVVHISQNNRRGYAYCTGYKFDVPNPDDKRPKILCSACRIAFVKDK